MDTVPAWYETHGNSIDAWLDQANSLMYAAGRLQQIYVKPDQRGPNMARRRDALLASVFLRTFVLECLLKALWLGLGNRLAEGGRYRGVLGVNNHDLVGMALRMEVLLSEEERQVLDRLTHFGEVGRYPIASRAHTDTARRYWGVTDSRHLARVATRIKNMIRKKRGV